MNLCHLDFDIPNMEFTPEFIPGSCSPGSQQGNVSSLAPLSGDIRISSLCYINSTNSYVRIYKQIMQNKPKVKYAKISVNTFVASIYVQVIHLVIQTNKAKQSQFKPKQTQNKPNQTQTPDIVVNRLRTNCSAAQDLLHLSF